MNTMNNKKHLLAVYGTLRNGCGNHRVLGDAKYLGSMNTKAEFSMYSLGGYPAIRHEGDTSIFVEIYEANKEDLQRVYQLEGYTGTRDHLQNWYDTLDIDTPYGKAEMFYFKEKLNRPLITSGDWKEFRNIK